jgi:transcriptional regulator
VLLERERGSLGTVVAHMARANPQWQHFTPDNEVLLIFQGPHAYVSPTWYKSEFGVPTWNYTAVHLYGQVQLVQEANELMAMLDKLVAQHEDGRPQPYAPQWADKRAVNLTRAIVGFELTITRIEGKQKLSQNRSKEDQVGAIAGLQGEGYPDALAVAQLMEAHIR